MRLEEYYNKKYKKLANDNKNRKIKIQQNATKKEKIDRGSVDVICGSRSDAANHLNFVCSKFNFVE